MRQVAQLVHHYVVLQAGGKLCQPIVKAEVAERRAGAPPRARVAYKDFFIGKPVVPVKMLEPCMSYGARRGSKLFELQPAFGGSAARLSSADNAPAPDNGEPRHCLEYSNQRLIDATDADGTLLSDVPYYAMENKVMSPKVKDLKKVALSEDEVSLILRNREATKLEERLQELNRRLAVVNATEIAHEQPHPTSLPHGTKADVRRSARKATSYHGEVDIDKIAVAVLALVEKRIWPSRKAVAAKLGVGYQNLAYCLRKHPNARRAYDQAMKKARSAFA